MFEQFQFKAIPQNLPESNLLYHYTDSKGLHGIISSGSIWATQLQYLNDRKEFQHAVDVAKNILTSIGAEAGKSQEELFIYLWLYDRVERMNGARSFVISLSEEPDLLSQWRAYGGKGGYSIGFDCNKMLTLAHKRSFRLIKCIYNESTQKELIASLITDIANIFLENPSKYSNDVDRQPLGGKFYSSFLLMGSAMKHPTFSEEKEWRLVGGPFAYDSPHVKVRPTDSILLPYYNFPLQKDEKYAIDNVWIGPHDDRLLAIESTNLFLGSMKKDWKTNYSSCPFKINK